MTSLNLSEAPPDYVLEKAADLDDMSTSWWVECSLDGCPARAGVFSVDGEEIGQYKVLTWVAENGWGDFMGQAYCPSHSSPEDRHRLREQIANCFS